MERIAGKIEEAADTLYILFSMRLYGHADLYPNRNSACITEFEILPE